MVESVYFINIRKVLLCSNVVLGFIEGSIEVLVFVKGIWVFIVWKKWIKIILEIKEKVNFVKLYVKYLV